MTIPDRIVVGPHTFRVFEEAGSESEGYYGEINYGMGWINIRQKMPDSLKAETLIHEVVHAWLEGMPLKEDHDEFLANYLGVMITMFIRDNPDVVKYIQDATRGEQNARSS